MRNTKKGFTLVELLVVIAILAILATVSVVGYTSFIDRANDSNAETELHQIQSYINADLMADNKWEYKLEDGTAYVVTKTGAKLSATKNGTACTLKEAIESCPDLAGLGTFEVVGSDLVYTASNGKGEAKWLGVVDAATQPDDDNNNPPAHTHAYNTPNHDETQHWNECSCGDKSDVTAHNYNTPNHDETQHWNECSCGAKSGEAAHTYANKGATCDNCGNDNPNTVVFYFVNDYQWNDVYCYTWTTGNPEVHQAGGWPGTKMDKVSTTTTSNGARYVYKVVIEANANTLTGVIFSDGKGNDNGGQQTPNITKDIADGDTWIIYWDGSINNVKKYK